jgi:DNA-binding MarR family transcriptional regulator
VRVIQNRSCKGLKVSKLTKIRTGNSEGSDSDDDSSGVIRLSPRDAEDAARLLKILSGSAERPSGPIDRSALVQVAERVLTYRRFRSDALPSAMFGEPAWDILLGLYAALGDQDVNVSSLVELSGAPATTTLRWIDYLEGRQLISRKPHTLDRRVALIRLTDKAIALLDSYFARIVQDKQ